MYVCVYLFVCFVRAFMFAFCKWKLRRLIYLPHKCRNLFSVHTELEESIPLCAVNAWLQIVDPRCTYIDRPLINVYHDVLPMTPEYVSYTATSAATENKKEVYETKKERWMDFNLITASVVNIFHFLHLYLQYN